MQTTPQIARLAELTELLSQAARAYEQEDREIISNYEYDRLYDELLKLEEETGIVFPNSPTHKVGYEVLSELPKETHESPMLSLNKTKSRDELSDWLGSHKGILSWKMDGLTIVLTYKDGHLFKAVTRGNGEVGEVVTSNARVFKNVPLQIPYKGQLVIRGEAVIRYSDFQAINARIEDIDSRYKNPRNLCSGSVRQLDTSVTASRSVYLYAFALISMTEDASAPSFTLRSEQLDFLSSQGFDVVEHCIVDSASVKDALASFESQITSNDFPSDGLVLIYDDIEYGRSLGRTAKFPRDGIAFKWADETAVTTLRDIEWSASRTGLINPVAIFDPVELEGTTVSRASLHNISIIEDLRLGIGDQITVYKANMIIPQIAENLTRSNKLLVPASCPVCACPTRINIDKEVKTLYCDNPACSAKQIKHFAHMAARDALNIDGLSESTIEKLINAGLLHNLPDLFKLRGHESSIAAIEGLGDKSCSKLLDAIDTARTTSLAKLIYSLGIPNIGLANAKLISSYADNDPSKVTTLSIDELTAIDKIGPVLAASFTSFFMQEDNMSLYNDLLAELTLEAETMTGTELDGKIFVITGSVNHFTNRDELKTYIEAHGGKVASAVSAKTTYLINNDLTSTSGKNKKAKELGVEIISEDTFLEMCPQN